MRFIICFALGFFGLCSMANAQLDKAAFPFSYLNTSIKSLSLGNATVSLDGIGNEEINPAVLGEEGVIQVSPSWHNYEWPNYMSWEQRGVNLNYRQGNSIFGFSLQRIESGNSGAFRPASFIYKYLNYEVLVRANYSHAFNGGLSVGVGLNYLYSGPAAANTSPYQKTEAVDAWNMDIGANYQFSEIRFDRFSLHPHLGVAITDFGMPSHYARPDSKHPMPSTLRIGGGTNLTMHKKAYGRNIIAITAMQNVSKILARMVEKPNENGVYFDAMNPFKALYKSWDTYTYWDYQQRKADFNEQLWWHSGVELTFLETLALRWGYQKAGKAEEELTYLSLGAGIDLYYLVFDYTYINSEEYENLFGDHHWQLTGRIPLDGKQPDTILHHIFDW